MKKYSKIIGMVVGLAIGAAVNFGLLPDSMNGPEIQTAVLGLLSAIGVYAAPANA